MEPTLPLFDEEPARPLADRLRPTRLEDVVGQDHLLAPDAPLGLMVAQQRLGSAILWGPPGVGKTTIARLLADGSNLAFEPVSATFSGVADLRKVFVRKRGHRNGRPARRPAGPRRLGRVRATRLSRGRVGDRPGRRLPRHRPRIHRRPPRLRRRTPRCPRTGSLMPPAHILNAPTRLMKDLGYVKGYQYDPGTADGSSGADYLPEGMDHETYYQPTRNGYEAQISERLRHWNALRARRRSG